MSSVDVGACMFEIACKDVTLATFFLLHNSLGLNAVSKLAQENLRTQIFEDALPLKKILGWALTEPGNGSHITTTAEKVNGGYVLNGRKKQIGNGVDADYVLIWARNENEDGKVQCFLVRKGAKGWSSSDIKSKF